MTDGGVGLRNYLVCPISTRIYDTQNKSSMRHGVVCVEKIMEHRVSKGFSFTYHTPNKPTDAI